MAHMGVSQNEGYLRGDPIRGIFAFGVPLFGETAM